MLNDLLRFIVVFSLLFLQLDARNEEQSGTDENIDSNATVNRLDGDELIFAHVVSTIPNEFCDKSEFQ